jgi:hypothetical protein
MTESVQVYPAGSLQSADPFAARAAGASPATLLMRDTSNPNHQNIGAQVAAGYLGGMTPHAWDRQDWAAQGARWRLAIWVPANPNTGQQEGAAAAEAAHHLGYPKGAAIGWDLETNQWSGEVDAAAEILNLAGYGLMPYGSASTVFANPVHSGYWVADWTGQPHLYARPGVVATQYNHDTRLANGVPVDESLILPSVTLWDTRPPDLVPTTLQRLQAAGAALEAAGAQLKAITSIP